MQKTILSPPFFNKYMDNIESDQILSNRMRYPVELLSLRDLSPVRDVARNEFTFILYEMAPKGETLILSDCDYDLVFQVRSLT